MPSILHIINKQAFNFECVQSEHAFQIEKRFDYNVQSRISKILEKACDNISAGDADIRIPLLEIDLGEIHFDRLDEEMVSAFEKSIYGKLSGWKDARSSSTGVLDKNRSSVEILCYFLLTGQLPWFAARRDEAYLAQLFEEVFASQSETFRQFVLLNLDNEPFIKRLANQSGPGEIEQVGRLLDEDIFGARNNLLFAMEALIRDIVVKTNAQLKEATRSPLAMPNAHLLEAAGMTGPGEIMKLLIRYLETDEGSFLLYIRKLAWEFILMLMSDDKKMYTRELFIEQLGKIFVQKFGAGNFTFYSSLLQTRLDTTDVYAGVEAVRKKLVQDIQISADENPGAANITGPVNLHDLINEATVKLRNDQTVLGHGEDEADLNEGPKFYISNAGLALIAHYLPVFFNELHLLDDHKFISRDHQVRAVFLLYYLCTGREEVPEYILPFNKILCGLSLEETLPSSLQLTAAEKFGCQELLGEVINNWQRLGNLSVEGFRESFLNREGALTLGNHGWKLQVERLGYDVLLDGLPWSFKHIKLSWMENLITTEW